MGPERKLYLKLKKYTPAIKWTRLENLSSLGTPDCLGYNNSGHYFTVELKVTKGKKIKFSPHQIAFHVEHPKNSYILIEDQRQRSSKHFPWFLYHGAEVEKLVNHGLELEPWAWGLDPCSLELVAWASKLDA
tara:strand:+ start:99 stop:494 length:396 start_codon:yes stop_codon:yes gene_type:complete